MVISYCDLSFFACSSCCFFSGANAGLTVAGTGGRVAATCAYVFVVFNSLRWDLMAASLSNTSLSFGFNFQLLFLFLEPPDYSFEALECFILLHVPLCDFSEDIMDRFQFLDMVRIWAV